MKRRTATIAAVAALALVTGCTSTPSYLRRDPAGSAGSGSAGSGSAPAGTFQPGSDGVGDPYYPTAGNGGYDVGHYGLDVRYDPATDILTGTATITATATAALSRFDLDFTGLTAQSVTVNGTAAMAEQSGAELVITPAQGLGRGSRFEVVVRYGGVPAALREEGLGEVGFLSTSDGAVAIGEPEVAASWFPVNDHPRDKATYTIKLTAPDPLAALSNGTLQGVTSSAGWKTWTWSVSKPMASYLATMVIGDYRVSDATHEGRPVLMAVDSSLPADVDEQLRRTPEVVDFLETKFGPYPFDAMGGIVINDDRIRFALENQTRPIYSQAFFESGQDATWVIVHELAHQWYGDSVSVDSWRHIWLNEGFATYAEWLWAEQQGQQPVQRTFDSLYLREDSDIWSVPPGDPGRADLFHRSVYTRGAMTLHALRVTVGDPAFFTILRTWASEHADGNATTDEFIALAERISGSQLDTLFHDWLFGTTRPPHP